MSLKNKVEKNKTVQELRVLATKPKNLSLISRSHMVETVLCPLCVHIKILRKQNGKQSKKAANTNLWTHTRVWSPTYTCTHLHEHILTTHTYTHEWFLYLLHQKKKSLSLRVDQYVKFSRNILESHLLTEMSRGQS